MILHPHSRTYEAPIAKIIVLEPATALCASAVGTDTFITIDSWLEETDAPLEF